MTDRYTHKQEVTVDDILNQQVTTDNYSTWTEDVGRKRQTYVLPEDYCEGSV